MMAVNVKQLSEVERCWISHEGSFEAEGTYAWQGNDRRIVLSRHDQAMLDGAGSAPLARWHVVEVKRGCDVLVDNQLKDLRIERWMAQETIVVRRRSRYGITRPKAKIVPFLPGYIFVKVVWCASLWYVLSALKGVIGVLGGPERPPFIAEAKILKLRADIERDPVAVKTMMQAFAPGEKVSVDVGPFASFPAEVVALKDKGRALIEVLIFGRPVSVELDLAQISKT